MSEVSLLCPACASPLDTGLSCSTCQATFQRDAVSGAILLSTSAVDGAVDESMDWDEVWTSREHADWGSNLRLRQRALLFSGRRPAMRVLEVGVGSGFNVELLDTSRIESYVGLDLSVPALRQAHRTLSRASVPHTLIACDVTRDLPFSDRFDTIFIFGVLYQFDRYIEILDGILKRHALPGAMVYGAEPIHALGSKYQVRRGRFLRLLRSRGDARVLFMEGLVCRAARKVGGPNWLIARSALWTTPSGLSSPFAYYMQYALRVR